MSVIAYLTPSPRPPSVHLGACHRSIGEGKARFSPPSKDLERGPAGEV